MDFGDKLKAARINAGFTQEQLARQIGVAKSTLTGYEKGNREPDVPKLKALSAALGVTGDYLLGTEDFLKNKKSPEISPKGKYGDIIEMLNELKPDQIGEVRGYIKRILQENAAADTAKQINGQLA